MTKLEIDIDIGEHPANLVAESIEVTLKAVSKAWMNADDADAVFDLQTAFLLHHEKHLKKFHGKDWDIFKHSYHWTDEQLRAYGFEPKK